MRRAAELSGAASAGLVMLKPGPPALSSVWAGRWNRSQRQAALDLARDSVSRIEPLQSGGLVAVPLVMRGRCLASLVLSGPSNGRALGRASLRDAGVSAVVHEATFDMIAWEATTDSLTLLANNRAIRASLDAALSQGALSLLMIDVDHFRLYNERFGHESANLALQRVGRAISVAAGPSAQVGRYGGEEFLVVLPGASPLGAVQTAERIRAQVEGDEGLPAPATVSVGCAHAPAHDRRAEGLLRAADSAMYTAKRNGRNRVEVFEPGMQDGCTEVSATPITELAEALRRIEEIQAEVAKAAEEAGLDVQQRRLLVASRIVGLATSDGSDDGAALASGLLGQLAPQGRRRRSA